MNAGDLRAVPEPEPRLAARDRLDELLGDVEAVAVLMTFAREGPLPDKTLRRIGAMIERHMWEMREKITILYRSA